MTEKDGPAAATPSEWTPSELQAFGRAWRHQLSEAAKNLTALDAWAQRLPEHHVPNGEAVVVGDMLQEGEAQPLAQALGELDDAIAKVAAASQAARAAADTALFGGLRMAEEELAAEAAPQMLDVRAVLGSAWGDDETFERQRRAVRDALEFNGRSWHGRLPGRVNDDLRRWQALIDAAEAGAGVRLSPAFDA